MHSELSHLTEYRNNAELIGSFQLATGAFLCGLGQMAQLALSAQSNTYISPHQ